MEVLIENVSKKFGSTAVLDDVSLNIKEGEMFFLLGPSGCGKTTLLRLLAGFYFPDYGRILFDNKDVSNAPPHKRNTSMVFQNYALWPHLTVFKNVEYGLKMRNISKDLRAAQVSAALAMVRMEDFANRNPGSLSGGQQQRIALARALVVQPDLLLLDEPLSNLDAKLRLEMRSEIRRLHELSKKTTIYVTHDQIEALSMADRIAVIKDGKIIQVGEPQEIYNKPKNKFVASFIGETNFIEAKIITVKDNSVILDTPAGKIISTWNDVRMKMESERISSNNNRMVCCIRPEAFLLNLDSNSSQLLITEGVSSLSNKIKGIVKSKTYIGNLESVIVECQNSIKINVSIHNPNDNQLRIGDAIEMSVLPKDVMLFSKDE